VRLRNLQGCVNGVEYVVGAPHNVIPVEAEHAPTVNDRGAVAFTIDSERAGLEVPSARIPLNREVTSRKRYVETSLGGPWNWILGGEATYSTRQQERPPHALKNRHRVWVTETIVENRAERSHTGLALARYGLERFLDLGQVDTSSGHGVIDEPLEPITADDRCEVDDSASKRCGRYTADLLHVPSLTIMAPEHLHTWEGVGGA
jgi:hypothetical protein